ncbi:FG-GAP-like repeat-containing protein [Streptomyces sp. NPDC048106]|uniref:FG-GAP-like repeat-containing protein n=1 Tax=Streptomyces sp. NPDC048106 TaxID=3155750 RepID=UPI0034572A1D
MKRRSRTVLATAVAAALAGGLTVGLTGPAAAAGTTTAAKKTLTDFNGDGYGDFAVSAPAVWLNGKWRVGAVTVFYGSAQGAAAERHTTITQDASWVPGAAENGDLFGAATTAGDFDGDGYTDLAVGTPLEDVDTDVNGGLLQIMWGSAKGLTSASTVPDPAPAAHDRFGAALAAGDFDGDGRTDLAVGTNGSTLYTFRKGISRSGKAGAVATRSLSLRVEPEGGIINLTAGDVTGDGRADLMVNGLNPTKGADGTYYNINYFVPGTSTGPSTTSAKKMPGGTTAIGDVDGDGRGDIVTGVYWGRATTGGPIGGKVVVTYGSSSGPSTRTQTITEESGTIPGDSEDWDKFGQAVALGDINGDGLLDLAVGAPGENMRLWGNMYYNLGSVTVLYGSKTGVDTSVAPQYFHYGIHGVPGEPGGNFGSAVLLNDLDHDGGADLIVGVPWQDNGAGAVTVLPSAPAADGQRRITSVSGTQQFKPGQVGLDTLGIPQFGSILQNARRVSDINLR